jgi:uncharacterized cupredoxin-like copper-binding protein
MRLHPIFAITILALVGGPVAAQQPAVITVQLADFKFTPSTIMLDHGQSYVLRLANAAGGGHDFTAHKFFDSAAIAPDDRHWVAEGEVEVPTGQVREIRLTAPAAGSYDLKCSHSFHKMFGMSGKIVVR